MMDKNSYSNLMEYIRPILIKLNHHEYEYSLENPAQRNPDIHNIIQINFPISLCERFENEHFSICYNKKFADIVRLYERCLASDSDSFETGNASEILKTLYEKSQYHSSFEDYKLYLLTEACYYVIESNQNGFGDVLRIDLYRKEDLKPGTDIKEFTGGLFHCLKHFTIKENNLVNNSDVSCVSNIFDIIYLIGKCFINRRKECLSCINSGDNRHYYKAVFFKEEDSNIFFLKTFHIEKKHKNHLFSKT